MVTLLSTSSDVTVKIHPGYEFDYDMCRLQAQSVDQGIAADSVPESAIEVPVETASTEAIQRVLRHRDNLIAK